MIVQMVNSECGLFVDSPKLVNYWEKSKYCNHYFGKMTEKSNIVGFS